MALVNTKDYRQINKLSYSPISVSSEAIYLLDTDYKTDFALWSFIPEYDRLMMHASTTPEYRGRAAYNSAKEAIHWVFYWINPNAIYANIENSLRHVQFMCAHIGFSRIQINEETTLYQLKNDQRGKING